MCRLPLWKRTKSSLSGDASLTGLEQINCSTSWITLTISSYICIISSCQDWVLGVVTVAHLCTYFDCGTSFTPDAFLTQPSPFWGFGPALRVHWLMQPSNGSCLGWFPDWKSEPGCSCESTACEPLVHQGTRLANLFKVPKKISIIINNY